MSSHTDQAEPLARGPQGNSVEFTRRELQVLQLIADGCIDPEIAAALGLSRATVKTHIASARMKLGARTRTAAACESIRRGLID